jgi:helicase MOV-10
MRSRTTASGSSILVRYKPTVRLGSIFPSVVKLVKNFRSHEAILKFPNESFYRGDLQAFASRQVIDSFINKAILPNPRFPILFHGIVGKDDRDASSPSFFNVDEVTQIKDYVMKLKEKYRTSSYHILS